MIKRIVKMTFQEAALDSFLELFEDVAPKIRAFPGCQHLELWQDTSNPKTLFTYSHWNHPDDLEAYRSSELFRATWKETKAKFAERAQAWSVEVR